MFNKNQYETAMAQATDEEFYDHLLSLQEKRNIYFREDLPREVLEQCMWCVWSGDYEVWSDNWVRTPDDIQHVRNFSAPAVRTNPYKHGTAKYYVYGLIYSYAPITRKDIIHILSENDVFQKKAWNILTSVDNTVYEMKQSGVIEKNSKKEYILNE